MDSIIPRHEEGGRLDAYIPRESRAHGARHFRQVSRLSTIGSKTAWQYTRRSYGAETFAGNSLRDATNFASFLSQPASYRAPDCEAPKPASPRLVAECAC